MAGAKVVELAVLLNSTLPWMAIFYFGGCILMWMELEALGAVCLASDSR